MENPNREPVKKEESSENLTDKPISFTNPYGITEEPKKNKKKISDKLNDIYEWLEMIIISFCAVIMVFTFILRPAVVIGDSMLTTLHDSETLLITPLDKNYEYRDIVIFQIPDYLGKPHGNAIVKRVIATEGQWIDINVDTWQVYVADTKEELVYAQPLEETYVNYQNRKLNASQTFPLQVGEGELFVMGDNRAESFDSRAFGCIKEEWVMGKVIMRIAPFNKFGGID